eukprot:TRINITY_DN1595_c0_g1_i1.p1 TRINITY_DN1595_c0_g1~~TRINITY_DN1595_c0_g1_i1.p1  ORF type:complete len:224 (-),score=41.27 TRINITY_DN1595_c0_g1_i1:27-698(-)
MKGYCSSMPADFWVYEICMEGAFKQSHGNDIYDLGHYAGFRSDLLTIEYDKGTPCVGKPGNPPRKTSVKLVCLKSLGPTEMIRLISVEEPAMCEYRVTVASTAVCGDPDFPEITAPPPVSSNEVVVDDGHEDWYLQISESNDRRLICSVYSLEYRPSGSALNFGQFSLQISSPSLNSNRPLPFVARHPGRVALSPKEITASKDGVQNTDQFDGKLAFLRVATE